MLMDKWTDVGHINLIGGLVTCNPTGDETVKCSILFLFNLSSRTLEWIPEAISIDNGGTEQAISAREPAL